MIGCTALLGQAAPSDATFGDKRRQRPVANAKARQRVGFRNCST